MTVYALDECRPCNSKFFFFFQFTQDIVRSRPKEIPHNEKLLSLKFEVIESKSDLQLPSSLSIECLLGML